MIEALLVMLLILVGGGGLLALSALVFWNAWDYWREDIRCLRAYFLAKIKEKS